MARSDKLYDRTSNLLALIFLERFNKLTVLLTNHELNLFDKFLTGRVCEEFTDSVSLNQCY